MKLLPILHALLGLTTTVMANKNLHTKAGDELLAETARLVNNVNIMEHEMINGMSVKSINDQLRRNALATSQILKRLNKEENTSYKELRTAIKANCAALKKEYKLEKSMEGKVSKRVKKLVKKAFKQCNKAQKRVRKLRGSYLLKNLRVKCEIYDDAIKSDDSNKQCITVHNHMHAMHKAVKLIIKTLKSETKSSKKTKSKMSEVYDEIKEKLRHAASLVSQLHTEVQGNCSKVKDAEIIKYTDSILDAVKSVLKDKDDADDEENEKTPTVGTIWDQYDDELYSFIDDDVVDKTIVDNMPKEEKKGKTRRQADGVNNIMTIISIVFSLSLLVFIGIGLALPKQSERIPHMSAGPRFDDGHDDNLLTAILKSVWWALRTATTGTTGYMSEKLTEMKDNGDWSFQNGWENVKTGAGYAWTGAKIVLSGAVYLGSGLISAKDHIASWKIWQSDQKFPYTSARAYESSKSAFGSVKGTVISMYDSTVYYVKGVYDLYKKSDSTSQRDEELQEMYLSDSDEEVLFSTDNSECVSGRVSAMTEYEENEYPLVEENVQIPDQTDKIEQAFKASKIEEAFKSKEQNDKQLLPVKSPEPPEPPARPVSTLSGRKTPNEEKSLAEKLESDDEEPVGNEQEYEEYSTYEDYTEQEEAVPEYTYTDVTDDEYQNGQLKSPPPPNDH